MDNDWKIWREGQEFYFTKDELVIFDSLGWAELKKRAMEVELNRKMMVLKSHRKPNG